jgi:hypothetical protein
MTRKDGISQMFPCLAMSQAFSQIAWNCDLQQRFAIGKLCTSAGDVLNSSLESVHEIESDHTIRNLQAPMMFPSQYNIYIGHSSPGVIHKERLNSREHSSQAPTGDCRDRYRYRDLNHYRSHNHRHRSRHSRDGI